MSREACPRGFYSEQVYGATEPQKPPAPPTTPKPLPEFDGRRYDSMGGYEYDWREEAEE
jgi:hypothetical protein